MRTLDLFRPSVGAFAVGMAQAALDAALDQAPTRRGLRRPADPAAVGRAHRWPRWRPGSEAARLLVLRRGRGVRRGAPAAEITQSAAMAKLFATETAQWVVDQAVQLHGARALQQGHLLERLYREVRAPADLRGRLRGPAHDHRPRAGACRDRAVRKGSRERTRYRGSVPITERLAALPVRGRRRRRHGDPEPAREAQPADLRVATPTCATCCTSCPTATTSTSWSSAARARASAAAATSTRSSAS